MTKVCVLSLLLLPLVAGAAIASEVDPYGLRQTTGVYVTVDRNVRTVYLDFASRRVDEKQDVTVPVTLTTDLPLWIEGRELPPGKHSWTLNLETSGRWSLGERSKGESATVRRHYFDVRDAAGDRPWLTACLRPDPDDDSMVLEIGYGKSEGSLVLRVSEKSETEDPTAGAVDLDRVSLVSRVERLRAIAGTIESTGTVRHVWSAALAQMGDALVADGGTAWVESMSLIPGPEVVMLTMKGRLPDSHTGLNRLSKAMKEGELRRLFPNTPIARTTEGGSAFQVVAQVNRDQWLPERPVSPLYEGDDLKGIAAEALLLDARISRLTKGSVSNLAEVQSRLLEAKREAGVIIGSIEPGEKKRGDDGVSSYSVQIVVAGSGAAIVRFLRLVESWEAALVLRPVKFGQGDFGPELTVLVDFWSYVPLAEREAPLFKALDQAGGGPNFGEKCELYLKGVGNWPVPPVRLPRWKRDPFREPEQEGQ